MMYKCIIKSEHGLRAGDPNRKIIFGVWLKNNNNHHQDLLN